VELAGVAGAVVEVRRPRRRLDVGVERREAFSAAHSQAMRTTMALIHTRPSVSCCGEQSARTVAFLKPSAAKLRA
jgi:hypothetical protein